MKTDLKKIRKIFPNWPSEEDIEKCSSNWFMRAQSFYCAAIVLNEEFEKTHSNISLTKNILIRQQGTLPAYFCLAFSLELAIKAAIVHQTPADEKPWLENHITDSMVKRIINLNLTSEEEKWIDKAKDIIVHGKYPVNKKPDKNKNGVKSALHFNSFHNGVESLYNRLITLSK